MNQVKIDIAFTKECIKSKSAFEALCLAVFLKAKYSNSLLYKHSARELKEITHLGTERLKRCLKMGQEMGLYDAYAGSARVVRLKRSKKRAFTIENCHSFKDIQKTLREKVILDKANQVRYVENIFERSRDANAPFTKKEYRRLQKLRNKVNSPNPDFGGTIKKSSIARLIGMSRSSVNGILKKMQINGLIEIIPHYVRFCDFRGALNLMELNDYTGSIYTTRIGDVLYTQVGNKYIPVDYEN